MTTTPHLVTRIESGVKIFGTYIFVFHYCASFSNPCITCSLFTRHSSLYVFLTLLFTTLQALSKTLTVDELFYLKGQFALLEPNKNGTISLENIKAVGHH